MLTLDINLNVRTQPTRTRPARRSQCGVSLIEALIALLLLALGVLGLAHIQTRTLVESRAGNERASAVRLAEDLQERIQANPTARASYTTNWDAATTTDNCTMLGTTPISCTTAQLASYDMREWKTNLAQALPGGKANVFLPIANDTSQFSVLIAWSPTQAKNEGAATSTEKANYVAPFQINTGNPNITCPSGSICHLVSLRP